MGDLVARLDRPAPDRRAGNGRFENGEGAFHARDSLRGKPILVRFLWLRTDTDCPRWEQAMSGDEGTSWETNWTMDFRRG